MVEAAPLPHSIPLPAEEGSTRASRVDPPQETEEEEKREEEGV